MKVPAVPLSTSVPGPVLAMAPLPLMFELTAAVCAVSIQNVFMPVSVSAIAGMLIVRPLSAASPPRP